MDVMDIANASMSMAQTQTMTDVGTAVLSMSLDMAQNAGANMVDMLEKSMMEQSVNPNVGGNIDIMI